jgi:hypothetical protein
MRFDKNLPELKQAGHRVGLFLSYTQLLVSQEISSLPFLGIEHSVNLDCAPNDMPQDPLNPQRRVAKRPLVSSFSRNRYRRSVECLSS